MASPQRQILINNTIVFSVWEQSRGCGKICSMSWQVKSPRKVRLNECFFETIGMLHLKIERRLFARTFTVWASLQFALNVRSIYIYIYIFIDQWAAHMFEVPFLFLFTFFLISWPSSLTLCFNDKILMRFIAFQCVNNLLYYT